MVISIHNPFNRLEIAESQMIDRLDKLHSAVHSLRQGLLTHPIYVDLRGPQALRTFMEYHVFAVWDFMSLLKSLQGQFCCLTVPWIPKASSLGSRFINEIVIGEETDEDGAGGHCSHFELYHRAMTKFGADTSRIDRFLTALQNGAELTSAFQMAEVPEPIQQFVRHTFDVIERGDLCRTASTFTFGREDLLPEVFERIVAEISQANGAALELFEFYLRRHIELDAGEHGPMASKLIAALCGTDEAKWRATEEAAVSALRSRLAFWNSIHLAIKC